MSQQLPNASLGPTLAPPNVNFAERIACRQVLGIPHRVDRWLTANIRTNRIAFLKDYLMLTDVNGSDCVTCSVQSVCSETPVDAANIGQPDTWTLYLTATAPARTGSAQTATTSPCAILEQYIGSKDAIDAPEWMQWDRSTEEFQQPRAAFAVLFTRMAFTKVNRDQVHPLLALNMVKWARSIAMPSSSLVQRLQPSTPQRSPSALENPRLLRSRTTRSARGQQGGEAETPTKPARRSARNFV
ncbi:hypothetical protein HWV62_6001 [Athelia sp. TMB]|nr:hypothetical protein HWV62_6001 [Athelia sp. TMB]